MTTGPWLRTTSGVAARTSPTTGSYEYTLDSRVSDLNSLVEHLDLRDITLVVHDWGGMIGMAWAVQNVERLSGAWS